MDGLLTNGFDSARSNKGGPAPQVETYAIPGLTILGWSWQGMADQKTMQ